MRSVALVLLALVISASAIDQTRFIVASTNELDQYGKLESKEDVLAFLKGVAYGLDVVMGDPTACIRDVTNMTSDFNDGVQLIAHGIKTLNVKSVMEGLFAFADGVEKVADAFKACGIEKTAESIIKIVTEIRNGEVMAFVKDEVMHIFSHGRELIHLFKDVAAQWKAKDFYAAGQDVGEILGILIDQEGDQIVAAPAPQDIYNLIRGVAEGMGSSMGDPSGCARDLDIIVAQMNAAWSDLKTGVKKLSVKTIERALLSLLMPSRPSASPLMPAVLPVLRMLSVRSSLISVLVRSSRFLFVRLHTSSATARSFLMTSSLLPTSGLTVSLRSAARRSVRSSASSLSFPLQ